MKTFWRERFGCSSYVVQIKKIGFITLNLSFFRELANLKVQQGEYPLQLPIWFCGIKFHTFFNPIHSDVHPGVANRFSCSNLVYGCRFVYHRRVDLWPLQKSAPSEGLSGVQNVNDLLYVI